MGISVTEIFNNALGKHLPRMFSDELILHSHTRTGWSVMSFNLNFLILYGLSFQLSTGRLLTKPCSASRYNKCNFFLCTDSSSLSYSSCQDICWILQKAAFDADFPWFLQASVFCFTILGRWRNHSSKYFLCCLFNLFTFHFLRS